MIFTVRKICISLLENNKDIMFRNLFISIAILLSFYNSYNIYIGYEQNYETNQANDFILRVVSDRVERKIDVDDNILLFKLPNPYYAERMPYDRPLIEKWMKKYYSLPENIVFEWK